MHLGLEALRISPRFTSEDWIALDQSVPTDWVRAVEIVKDRLEGRFLRFVDEWLGDPFSGFVVLSIDSLVAETIEQFRAGQTSGSGKSQRNIERFLSGPRFQPDFDEQSSASFYTDIRCGLLHQAEAKEMWLVRREQPAMLQKVTPSDGYIIDVVRFHAAVKASLDDYCQELLDPSQDVLRANLWKKMNHIARTRTARGALYEAPVAPQTAA